MTADFDCEAYGPEGRKIGALCFITADLGGRMCATAADCHRVTGAERQEIFRDARERAAAGDPVSEECLEDAFLWPGGGS